MIARRHTFCCHAACALALLGGMQAAAQTDDVEPAGEPRKVYVVREYLLEDIVPSRVKGHAYMPMARDQFENKLKAMKRIATDDVAGQAKLVAGVFYAKYQSGQLVDGRAGLEVVNKHQANSVLSLAPCRLPVRQLRWSNADAGNVTAGTGMAGDFVVFVDRSSRLLFFWSLRADASNTLPDSAAPIANTGASFSVSLPPSSINQLVIDLPTGLVPVVDVGETRLVNEEYADLAVVPAEVEPGSDRWLVALGGTHEFTLRVMDGAAATESRDRTRLRQATTFRLSKSAIEVQAEISLAFLQNELHRLVLQTDPDLRVAGVRIGARKLLPDQITRGSQPGQVVLTFDSPLQGDSRKLIVDAMSPLVMDEPMRLPELRPLDLAWEQSSAVLEIPDTLVLKKLVLKDAVETNVESRSGMGGGEVHHIRHYGPQAHCEVVIGRPSTQTVVTSGTAIAVSPRTLTAQIVADVHSVEGDVYVLDALIAPDWKVDSVESSPVDALDGTPARRTSGRQIRMQLRQPVSGGQKVRLLIKARRAMPRARTELNAEDFRIVEFGNVAAHRRLVALRAEAPYHLMVAGNSQPNVGPDALSDEDRALLGPFTSGYVDDGTNDSFRVSLTQEKPRYSGQLSVEAMVDSNVLRQAIRIHCQPESSPVLNLLVRLSPAPDVPLTWSTDEPDGLFSARLIKTPDTSESATWELQLRQSRTTPFHITAVCSSPLIETAPIYLASLAEALDQTGTVTIGAIDGTTFAVDANGLTAVPIVRPSEDEYTFQRVAYRYDPTRDQSVAVTRQTGPQTSTLAWVWECELVSRFETSGLTNHRVGFKIQNSGRPQAEITLPANATVDRVRVDDLEVSYAKASGDTRKITIQLPSQQRFPTVLVDYSTRGERLRDFGAAKVGWPQIDLFCLKRTWDVWLPPGIHARQDRRFVNTAVTPALRWEERLVSPSIFRRGKRPFDLFSSSDWQTIGQTASRASHASATSFVTAISNVVAASDTPDSANERLTWGQVMDRYERLRSTASSADMLSSLWIDANALREMDVTADTPYSTETTQSVSQILAQHHLAVVAGPGSILLTSVARLGDFRHELLATGDRNVFVTQHTGNSRSSDWGSGVSASAWSNEPVLGHDPWSDPVREDAEDFGVGWRHYHLRPAATSVVQFDVYRPAVFRTMGWGLSLVMIAAIVWFSTRRANTMVLVMFATVLTLLIPVPLVPVARGLMWGGWAGLLLTILRDKSIRDQSRAASPGAAPITLARTTVALLIGLGAWEALADDEARIVAPAAAKIYRVVVPVDEQQKPAGSVVFVPTQLFYSLHRRVATEQMTSLAWLLRSATYETSLAPRGDAGGLVEAEVSADFEVDTFQMDALVAFPLGRDRVRRLTNVKLDGQVIEPTWNASDEALEFSIARPGRHRLELAIRPVLRNDAESSGFALSVPKYAGARLQVRSSTRIEGIELPSAIGAINQSETLGTIDADLGPTDQLAVRWPLNSRTVAESIPLTATERFWLRIQPSSVVLEGQFSFSVPRGEIGEVRLLVDPRLKLSQLIPSQPANYEPQSGPIPSIVVRFDEPSETRVFVHATFLMTDTSGLGNVYPPRLSAVADVKGTPSLGLSVSPLLEAELIGEPQLQSILPAEFLADWKEPTDVPQLAYRLSETANRWHVNSRPVSQQPVAEQLSIWSIGWTRGGLQYSAEVDPGGQACFQQRLRVPRSVRIDKLEVVQGEVSHPLRWARANSILTVFFEQAITDRFRLNLIGEAPTRFREPGELPLVSLRDVEFQSDRLVVRQRSDVLVDDLMATGFVDESRSEKFGADGADGRFVVSYSRPTGTEDQKAPTVSCLTRRNRPKITGRIISYLSFVASNLWSVDTRVNLTAKSGVVDELRLGLPVGWLEPLQITPEISHEIVGSGAERVLVLRPGRPVGDQLRLQIRCQSQRATVNSSEVPLVKILNEGQVEQFLVLPSRQGEGMISWETSGLRQVQNLTAENSPLPNDASTTYRVEGTRVGAIVHNVGRLGGTPQVELADIHVAWNHDGTCYGVAAFDVIPLQMTECKLVVPTGLSIAHVNVAGGPVTWRSESETRLWIPLGPHQLPQRMEVVFFGRLASNAAIPGEMISAPYLSDLPVEQTLWTVYGPVGAVFDEALLEHARATEIQQARIRASSATQALAMAETLTPPVPELGFESWMRTWEQRRDLALSIVEGTRDARAGTPPSMLDLASRNLQETASGRGRPVRFAMQGDSSTLNIQFAADNASDLAARGGVSVVIVCLGLLLGFAVQRFRVSEWVEQSWHALGVGLGVVWWLWFTPSVIGLVLVGLFLTAAMWPVRKSRQAPRLSD